MSSSTKGKDISLNWDVLMTPGITIRTNTPAPNTKETFWHPLSSTLIYGMRDAVLVDTFLAAKQSNDLVNWVAAEIGHTSMSRVIEEGMRSYFQSKKTDKT
jgi:hypothetical protein